MFYIFFNSIFIIIFNTCIATNRWPNHEISTLKLLQIIHRHGDRAPTERFIPPNDPYKSLRFWPSGYTELTAQGRLRMYSLGQFIRQEYNQYLGDKYSSNEVYVRSSLVDRCIESVYCFLAGAYPPNHPNSQWSDSSDSNSILGSIWQPIPIETLMPRSNDNILNLKACPLCDFELNRAYKSKKAQIFLSDSKEFYKNLSLIIGWDIDTIALAHHIHDTLHIEMSNGYYWTHVWSESEQKSIVNQLYYSHLMSYTIGWNNSVIKQMRAGGLVKELIENIKKTVNHTNDKKIYIYSTHDIIIVALLHAFNVFDTINSLPQFGASIFVELHHNHHNNCVTTDIINNTNCKNKRKNGYFVRIYYFNETLNGTPFAINLKNCQNKIDCPLNMFLETTQDLLYNDFDKECQSSANFIFIDEENNQNED